MSAQFIELNEIEFAVIPAAQYRALLEKAEMADDITAYDRAKAELKSGEDEVVPSDVAEQLLDGANPVQVWRKYRGLTQEQLAKVVGVTKQYIGQMEKGRDVRGKLETLRAVADALKVDLDDIAPH